MNQTDQQLLKETLIMALRVLLLSLSAIFFFAGCSEDNNMAIDTTDKAAIKNFAAQKEARAELLDREANGGGDNPE